MKIQTNLVFILKNRLRWGKRWTGATDNPGSFGKNPWQMVQNCSSASMETRTPKAGIKLISDDWLFWRLTCTELWKMTFLNWELVARWWTLRGRNQIGLELNSLCRPSLKTGCLNILGIDHFTLFYDFVFLELGPLTFLNFQLISFFSVFSCFFPRRTCCQSVYVRRFMWLAFV